MANVSRLTAAQEATLRANIVTAQTAYTAAVAAATASIASAKATLDAANAAYHQGAQAAGPY